MSSGNQTHPLGESLGSVVDRPSHFTAVRRFARCLDGHRLHS